MTVKRKARRAPKAEHKRARKKQNGAKPSVSARTILEAIIGKASAPDYVRAQSARALLRQDRFDNPAPPPRPRQPDRDPVAELMARTVTILEEVIAAVGDDDEAVEKLAVHRGVGIEAGQSPEQVVLVKGEIEHVFDALSDPQALHDWASTVKHSPESRMVAASKLFALSELAVRERRRFPIRRSQIVASVAGLNSRKWRDPFAHCSITENPIGAARRDQPLGDDPRWD